MPISAVCAIVKNEQDSIVEWIAFQKVIGFDEVLIYDNGSSDKTLDIVKAIAKIDPTVIYVNWPDRPGEAPQTSAYQHALTFCRAEWIAFFDVDEFLILKGHKLINELLRNAGPNISAFAINWRIFGSSGKLRRDPGLAIERFILCSNENHPKNRFYKSIVNRKSVKQMRVHSAILSSGFYADSAGNQIQITDDAKLDQICFGGAQLNHYLLKSWAEFQNKRRRGNAARPLSAVDKFSHRGSCASRPNRFNFRTLDGGEYWITHDLNQTFNFQALKYVGQVKGLFIKWNLCPPSNVIATIIYESLKNLKSLKRDYNVSI